jgi:hypothetical protein
MLLEKKANSFPLIFPVIAIIGLLNACVLCPMTIFGVERVQSVYNNILTLFQANSR